MDREFLRLAILIAIFLVNNLISLPMPEGAAIPAVTTAKPAASNDTTVKAAGGAKYSYNDSSPDGPSHWPGECNVGMKQSPVGFTQGQYIRKTSRPTVNITFDAVNAKDAKSVKVVNTGHGANYFLIYANETDAPKISDGILGDDVYQLASFHMHWPCEHSFVITPTCQLELHLVHFNVKYKTLEESLNKPDGLAVIALLYIVALTSNMETLPFIPLLKHVAEPNSEYVESNATRVFSYLDIIDANIAPRIVSYKGSLTTPGCAETVTWLIFATPHLVLQSDLNQLRRLKDSEGKRVMKNNRPTQPLNSRSIYLYAPFY